MGVEELFLATERKRAERNGERRSTRKTIYNMLHKNFAEDLVAEVVGVPLDYVQKMRLSLN